MPVLPSLPSAAPGASGSLWRMQGCGSKSLSLVGGWGRTAPASPSPARFGGGCLSEQQDIAGGCCNKLRVANTHPNHNIPVNNNTYTRTKINTGGLQTTARCMVGGMEVGLVTSLV